jgi:CRISPR-associated endoribonuclease Cas6
VRIRIIFRLRNKGATLPFQHQHLLHKLVEQLLDGTDFEHPEAAIYNFSALKGQTKVSRMGLSYLSNRVTLVLSSLSNSFIEVFKTQLFKHKLLEIGEIILTPEFTEEEKIIDFTTSMKYLCLSPLIPSNTLTESTMGLLAPETMSDMLYESTLYRMEKSELYTPQELEEYYQFQLVPDIEYLQKLSIEEKKPARPYFLYKHDQVSQELIGYTFPFELYAHPAVQNFIYYTGFGEFTNQGYGMLDTVNNNLYRPIKTRETKINFAY